MIVESYPEAQRIAGMLGAEWRVEATGGPVCDFPPSQLGIALQADFALEFVPVAERVLTIARLRQAIRTATAVFIATRPDAEGEAQAWQIVTLTKADLKQKPFKRIHLQELEQAAVLAAINASVPWDPLLVEATHTRRAIDRLVAYMLSPLLCQALSKAIALGRTQGLALMLLDQRARIIVATPPVSTYTVQVTLQAASRTFTAELAQIQNRPVSIPTLTQADQLRAKLMGSAFWVKTYHTRKSVQQAPAPFTLLALMEEAHRQFGWPPERTRQLLDALYLSGRIGYPGALTDSSAVEKSRAARRWIEGHFGQPALREPYPDCPALSLYPVDPFLVPEAVPVGPEASLYRQIWSRFVASHMADAVYALTEVEIAVGTKAGPIYPVVIRTRTARLVTAGHLALAPLPDREPVPLPDLAVDQDLELVAWQFTQQDRPAPQPYTELDLLQALDLHQIGHPLAHTRLVSSLQRAGLVTQVQDLVTLTALGAQVATVLRQHFAACFAPEREPLMDRQIQDIAAGQLTRSAVLQAFWETTLQPAVAASAKAFPLRRRTTPLLFTAYKQGAR